MENERTQIHSFCANIFNVSQCYPFNYVTKSHYCHSIKPDSRSALYCYITLTFGISLRTRGLAAFMLHKGCSPIRTFEAKLEEIVSFLNNCNNAHVCRITSIRKMDSKPKGVGRANHYHWLAHRQEVTKMRQSFNWRINDILGVKWTPYIQFCSLTSEMRVECTVY